MKRLTTAFFMAALCLVLTNCGKSSNSGTSASTASYVTCPSTGYYVSNNMTYTCSPGSSVYIGTTGTTICPSNGYYVSNNMTYQCTPGTTVYTNGTTSPTTAGYVTCPSTGYYMSNNMAYQCTPGTTVYTGGTTSVNYSTANNPCIVYGANYVPVLYQGQYYCVANY